MDYRTLILQDSPIGYWPLDDLNDATGHGYNFGASGGPSQTAGLFGQGYRFVSASSQYLLQSQINNPTRNLESLECWVKMTAVGSGTTRTLFTSGSYQTAHMKITATDAILFGCTSVGTIATSTTIISDTNWHHVVCTKNGSTSKIYLDSVDVTGTVTNQDISNTGTNNCLIGADWPLSYTDFSNDTIDEVAFYAYELTPNQVRRHYLTGVGLDHIRDTFTRTVSNAWGTSDSGHAWTAVGTASDIDVDGSRGTIQCTSGTSSGAQFNFGSDDFAGSLKWAFGSAWASNLIRITLWFRTDFKIKIEDGTGDRINLYVTDGSDNVISPNVVIVNPYTYPDVYALRFDIRGNMIRAKAWKDGTAEPDWQAIGSTGSRTVSLGDSNFQIRVEDASSNHPICYIDDLDVGWDVPPINVPPISIVSTSGARW